VLRPRQQQSRPSLYQLPAADLGLPVSLSAPQEVRLSPFPVAAIPTARSLSRALLLIPRLNLLRYLLALIHLLAPTRLLAASETRSRARLSSLNLLGRISLLVMLNQNNRDNMLHRRLNPLAVLRLIPQLKLKLNLLTRRLHVSSQAFRCMSPSVRSRVPALASARIRTGPRTKRICRLFGDKKRLHTEGAYAAKMCWELPDGVHVARAVRCKLTR
jgi:hypothetical protein